MTEPPPAHPASAPSGERPVVLTYDALGRVGSSTEHHPGGSEPERVTHFRYDELDRSVEVRQISHETLSNPGTP